MEEIRRKRREVLQVKTVGIDNTFKTQQGHNLGTNFSVIVETEVVENDPEGKKSVQVGIVCQHDPVALAEVETLANQYHGLFAGGQGSNAPFVMVEVVNFLLNIDERIALCRTVEKNRSRRGF